MILRRPDASMNSFVALVTVAPVELRTVMLSDTFHPLQVHGVLRQREIQAMIARVKFGEESIIPRLADLKDYVQKRFQEDGPKANYSGLGALQDRYVRNLSQLEKVSAQAHTAAIRAASSRAQAATILRSAVPAITKELEGSDVGWPELRLALIESRLRGLRKRWQTFSDQARDMTDEELAKAYDEHFAGLLEAIQGKKNLPQDIAQTAAALVEQGAYDDLRGFLGDTFTDAAARVSRVMEPEWFDAVTQDPKAQKALDIYKKLVEKPMAENHALNEGVFSDALGPLNTYYPLISSERPITSGPGRLLPYHKPRNMANAFATGLSAGYDATMEALKDRLASAVRSNDKAALLKTLEQQGLLKPLKHNQRAEEEVFTWAGNEYQAERVEISPARIILQNGKMTNAPASVGLMPKWLARELRPVLERQKYDTPTVIDRVLSALNTFALAGPADFVFHSSNLLGTLVANTPFLADSIAGKLQSAPFVKKFASIVKVATTDPTTPEAAAELIEMAKLGLIPDRYGSVTFSQKAAEELGAEKKRFSFSPLLFGPKGLDVRARLVMYRLAKQINPDATPQQLFHFVNQLGNYVPALQGEMERALKASGFSPFYTAGSTMIRNGINAWTGRGPMPKDGIRLRLWQMLTGGALGTLALWIITYQAMTGKLPWEDRRAKLLAIPAPDELRHSALGRALWGTGPEVGYINFGFFSPLIMRGARATGVAGAFEARQLHGNAGQVMEAAQRDILNAFSHPALGPTARAAFVGVTGAEPYLTSFRDRSGKISPQFFPAIPPKTRPGLPALGARAAAAAKELNAFYGNLGVATGMAGDDKGMKGNHWLRMVTDLTMPGLVSNATNPYKKAEALRAQRAGAR